MAQSVKPADAGVSVGQVFQGKYRVDAILGHGGMGVVAECTHLALNERVAVKMLRQDVLMDQDAVSRFIREAQAAVKLKSEYVARVTDVGTFENGVPYMVMEFLEGLDLGELLQQRGVLPVPWAVELMLQTAEALAEAHSLGIVHRDVKPTNLFVTWRPDGSALIKVLDFGISKSPMGTDMQLTQTQSLLGTPAYMSPEQMRSARLVDTRTDIWSLGTVMYEVLEGRRPFEAESFSEMCVKVAVDPPAPMVNTPPGLQQVILKCLAKSPEQRYATMAELGRDLVPYAADPHAAQMLVERMSRMLRRSAYDWETGSTGTGVGRHGSVPGTAELGSGPVRAPSSGPQQWSVGSDPAAQPWNGNANASAQAWNGQAPRADGSNPFVRPVVDRSQGIMLPAGDEASAGYNATQSVRKSRAPLVLVLLGVLVAAALGIWLAQSDEKSTPKVVDDNETAPPTEDVAPRPVEPAPGPSDPAPVQSDVTTPEDTTADTTPTVTTDATPDTTPDAPKPDEAVTSTTTTVATQKKVIAPKTATKVTTKVRTNVKKPPQEATEKPAEPAKKCNPFDSMHGYGCETKPR